MKSKLEIKKKMTSEWFQFLQLKICEEFERLEKMKSKKKQSLVFNRKTWTKSKDSNQGGGKYAIIKNGSVFDSVGVNFSEVSGKFNKKFKKQILGAKKTQIIGLQEFQ